MEGCAPHCRTLCLSIEVERGSRERAIEIAEIDLRWTNATED